MLALVIAAWLLVRLVVSIIANAWYRAALARMAGALRVIESARFVLRAWSLSQIGETERANKYLATLDQNEDWRLGPSSCKGRSVQIAFHPQQTLRTRLWKRESG